MLRLSLSVLAFSLFISACATAKNSEAERAPFIVGKIESGNDQNQIVFVVAGDFGTGTPKQYEVGRAIKKVCDRLKCKFLVGTGDNIYENGVKNENDSQWQSKFEEPYKNINFPFYMSLGNHDYLTNPDAQIEYAKKSEKMIMPARYYSFSKKMENTSIDFFAIDTSPIADRSFYFDYSAQENWLKDSLTQSSADWKIVFGHHPWKSNGSHGNANNALGEFFRKNLCGNADILLSGHDHDKQHLQPECGVQLFISGTAAKIRSVATRNNTIFAKSSYGFAVIAIEGQKLQVEYYNEKAESEYYFVTQK